MNKNDRTIKQSAGASPASGACVSSSMSSRTPVRLILACLGITLNCVAIGARSEPAQMPLLTRAGSGGSPNVMFTMDDSTSMELNYMPDGFLGGLLPGNINLMSLGFDPAEAASVPLPKSNFFATIPDGQSTRMRSPQLNLMYYNPEVRYRPWVRADGSPMPDAPPTAAPVHPSFPAQGTVNLVGIRNSVTARWCTVDGCDPKTLPYVPATYFVFNGGNQLDPVNFTQVRIVDHGSFVRGAQRTDCSPGVGGGHVCTQAQEYQNFANWFSYYRSRIFSAIAASSRAFGAQGSGLRLGYALINTTGKMIDGVGGQIVERGVRQFEGADREEFFNWLHRIPPIGGTPLQRAVDGVGQYFSRADNRGPWGATPGTNDATPHLACRRSYHVLVTDGVWTNNKPAPTPAANANNDGTSGPTITGPGGQSFTYVPTRPFQDAHTGTLADVAMYYWRRDLRPDLDNVLPASSADPAFWQHLVHFTVGFGVRGTLNPATDLPALESGALSWPSPTSGAASGAGKIDDLWHAAVNSRGRYLSATDADTFAESLGAILQEISARETLGGGAAVSGSSLDLPTVKFVPSFQATGWSGDVRAVNLDAAGQAGSRIWQASERVPDPAARRIVVGNGAGGAVPLRWASLDAAMKARIGPLASEDLVDWLRGDRSKEGTTFRARSADSVLGDFVNSPPLLIGGLLNEQYQFLPVGSAGRDTYRTFLDSKRKRMPVLYIGGNDGMLHGFRADDGVEHFAFMPNGVLEHVAELSQPGYDHRFFVDGPLLEADAHIGGGWRNLLLGSLGAGGRSVFAIDVTSPTAMNAGTVKWEFSHPQLGYTFAPPAVGVTRSGQWVAVFGNGVDSAAKQARLFVVDLNSGALLRQFVIPGPNSGLGGVRLVRDANNQIVAAYAGDLRGRLWRFDMNAPTPAGWDVGFGGQPLFSTQPINGEQPIMATPEYVVMPRGGQMVIFGTGRLYEEAHLTDTSLQSIYGIWDTTAADAVSAAGGRVVPGDPIVAQNFTTTVSAGAATLYQASNRPIDFGADRGWLLNLSLRPGQRALLSPQLVRGHVFVKTVIPSVGGSGAVGSCTSTSGEGISLLLNAINGGQSQQPVFDSNGDGSVTDADTPVAGWSSTDTGAEAVMAGSNGRLVLQGAGGSTVLQLNGRALERTWRQIVNLPG
ncbi:MAG: PilC/PilY family type IV pilus protein [Burkholderiaceae bacterium]